MRKISLLIAALSSIIFSCNNDSKKAASEQETYNKTKESLQQEEQKNPKTFILVEGHNKRNILGQTVVKGSVTNKATVAIFKDVDINLSFYSKTNALLETDKETVFELLHPGESKDFKTKYFAPKGTDSVALAVLGAKVVIQ
jgi:hypothetical protein